MSQNEIDGKKALIVSVSSYTSNKLENLEFCKYDGEQMAMNLKEIGFSVPDHRILVGNVSRDDVASAMVDFFQGEHVDSDDTLLYYYSGHGVLDGYGGRYFATSNVNTEHPELQGINFNFLTDQLKKSHSDKKVAILDCCFSGGASPNLIGKSGDDVEKESENLGSEALHNQFDEGHGSCILASSGSNRRSFALPNSQYSAFTSFILKGLRGVPGSYDDDLCVTPDTLSNYTYSELQNIPELRNQKPVRNVSAAGKIILHRFNSHDELQTELDNDDNEFNKLHDAFISNKIDLAYLEKTSNSFYFAKKYTLAIKLFDLILENDSTLSHIWNYRGIAKSLIGQTDDAFFSLDKAIDLSDNTWADPIFWKGQIFHRLGNLNEALPHYQNALNVDPKHIPSLYSSGQVHLSNQNISMALDCFTQILKIDPEHADSYVSTAMIYLQLGKFEDALVGLDHALQIEPQHSHALQYKGVILGILNRGEEALTFLDLAIRLNPDNDSFLVSKAEVLIQIKKPHDANSCLKKALRINPNNQVANDLLNQL